MLAELKNCDNAFKTASKRAIQKTAEVTGDLVGNRITDEITSISKKPTEKLQDDELQSNKANNETLKERYISPKEK